MAMVAALGVKAESSDSTAMRMYTAREQRHYTSNLYYRNPSSRPSLYKWNYMELSGGYGAQGGTVPMWSGSMVYSPERVNAVTLEMEEGDEMQAAGFDAIMSTRIGSDMTVWGDASYSKGGRNGAKWCETSDYRVVSPYYAADTIGGNFDREAYGFNAGMAYEWNKVDLGISIKYNSAVEYRTRDPRPLNSSLTAEVTAGGNVKTGMGKVGCYIALGKYSQEQRIKFFSALGTAATIYQMEGKIGTYRRFSQAYGSAAYKGHRLSAGMQMRLSTGVPIGMTVEYGRRTMEKILPETRNIVCNKTEAHQIGVEVLTERAMIGSVGWEVLLQTKIGSMKGFQVIYDDGSRGYSQIAEQPNYKQTLANSRGEIHLSLRDEHRADLRLGLWHDYDDSKNMSIGSREQKALLLRTIDLSCSRVARSGMSMMTGHVGLRGRGKDKGAKIEIPKSQPIPSMVGDVKADFERMTSRMTGFGVGGRIDIFVTKRIGSAFIEVDYGYDKYKITKGDGGEHCWSAKVGVTL